MKKTLLILTILTALFVPVSARADSATIDSLKVDSASVVNVSFMVRSAFTDEIVEAIKSGIPTSFTFMMEAYRVRGAWFDKVAGKWKFRHTVKYDAIKEEYVVRLDEKDYIEIRTNDFEEMKRLMSSGEDIAILPALTLIRGAVYEVRIKAQLDTVKLPFLLRHMLFFVKFWDFETDWYSARFTRK